MRIPIWLYRLGFNLFPAFRATGAWITDIADDWTSLRLRLPLTWRTKNVVGTTFGGSMFAAVDPMFMTLLRNQLGDDFTVWDRAGEIEFRKPGRDTLYAECRVPKATADEIATSLDPGDSLDRDFHVDLVDADGVVHASVTKTVYVRRDE